MTQKCTAESINRGAVERRTVWTGTRTERDMMGADHI